MFSDLQQDEANMLPRSAHSTPTVENLKALGNAMEDPGDGAAGNSRTPAIYTYFGQFVDHDITLEASSFTLGKLVDPDMVPLSPDKIRQLKNLRRPTLDLDSVYGDPSSPPEAQPPRAG